MCSSDLQFDLSGGSSVALVASASVLVIVAAALMLWNFWSHSGYGD